MRKKLVYIYYLILIVILAAYQSVATEPPLIMRLAYITGVVAPTLFRRELCFPAVLTLFYTCGTQGFAYSYMPYQLYIYVIITLAMLLLLKGARHPNQRVLPPIMPILAGYIFIVDVINAIANPRAFQINNNEYALLLIIMFLMMIGDKYEQSLKQFHVCFALIAIYFSVLLLTTRGIFSVNYNYTGIERVGWTDPNYLGMIMGMGVVAGLLQIFNNRDSLNIIEKIIFYVVVVLPVPALLLIASRGAILSIVFAATVLVYFSKVKVAYKILFVVIAAIGLMWLYNNQYFDLLIYRIENDSGGGSHRTEIWIEKLDAFFNGNPLKWFFGYGYYGGLSISGTFWGFHNDFVGFLVEYGLFGLLLFIAFIVYPIRRVPKHSIYRIGVVACVVYMITCCMTLEPYGGGRLPYYSFNLYTLVMANAARSQI